MTTSSPKAYKPVVLHIGEAIKYNHEFYKSEFAQRYVVIQNDRLDRESFKEALRTRAFGNFHAIFRPHFQSGGEMGQWDEELISLLPPSVKIFASAGAGFNWADVDSLARKGIWYANGAGASDDAVSDTALYMILSVFRNFTRSQLAARTADPDKFTLTHKLIATISKNPKDHILGIVGLGSISKKLVSKAQAIGMKVLYHDIVRQSKVEEDRLDVRYCETLAKLLRQADCVSLHVPLNANTKHLISKDTIAEMKDGARLVNTARGEIVEEQPLIEALRSGKLSAAGFDVHYNEPQVNPELAAMDNVTLTTHNAGGAIDTRINFEMNAMKNILAVIGADGETIGEPLTPVNKPVLGEAMPSSSSMR